MVDYKASGKVSHERQAKLTHYPSPLTRPPDIPAREGILRFLEISTDLGLKNYSLLTVVDKVQSLAS